MTKDDFLSCLNMIAEGQVLAGARAAGCRGIVDAGFSTGRAPKALKVAAIYTVPVEQAMGEAHSQGVLKRRWSARHLNMVFVKHLE